ncbi:hypothetical protein [Acaryochloris marina]|uniref:Conserved hypothetical membrane protein n=1 Tax=Acaryochloris marina (strain MBIC 11017) TaxID=329726 RepID=B0C243_ACAM1|nr:hypothetical protein [Acaryochloris marina]ABW27344.1 conserved hypothetical membrane protein [Acaryochloris marina MBIC11017]
MTSTFLNRVGNWNPQLLREFRGRLKSRSIAATIVVSLVGQTLLGLVFSQQTYKSVLERWAGLAEAMIWILPFALFTAGSYYLVSDLNQEEKRGTLNFIRLSPRPSRGVLLGKMLGVPILPYLAIGLAIPLHIMAGLNSGMPIFFLISYYLLLAAGCFALFSLAILYGLLSSSRTIAVGQQSVVAVAFAGLTLFFLAPLYMTWNMAVTWRPLGISEWSAQWNPYPYAGEDQNAPIQWFGQTINQSAFFSHWFTLSFLAIATALIWLMLVRLFRNPNTTVMSKWQSYAIVAFLEPLVLGFFVVTSDQANFAESTAEAGTWLLYAFNIGLTIVIMLALCPQRASLLDWVRFQKHPQGILRDLVWADKSPAILAIAINLIIINALYVPWMLLVGVEKETPTVAAIIVLSMTGVLLIYTAVVQQIFALKIRNPYTWTMGGLGLWMLVPPIMLSIVSIVPDQVPAAMMIWTFLGYPFSDFAEPMVISSALVGLVAQLCVIVLLVRQFQNHLQNLSHAQARPVAG